MKILLTKGLGGRSTKVIDAACKTAEDAFNKINAWKESEKNGGKYRICHYDRMIYDEKNNKIMIDFGDYSHFILIKCNKKEWADFEAWHNRPIDLEV